MSWPHQEGLSMQVQPKTQVRTEKNETKLADECISSRMWGFTNRQVVKLFLTDSSKQNPLILMAATEYIS
jgi:hypothetical protein